MHSPQYTAWIIYATYIEMTAVLNMKLGCSRGSVMQIHTSKISVYLLFNINY